ncbi:MAG: glycine cleavage system protein H [Acidobacteriota bacterium]|nr:glycine cleavage system protein H [Acidobacteriota bacterium]
MDFLQTKGLEYLLAIAYLVLLVPFWRFLTGSRGPAPQPARAVARAQDRPWFAVPDGFHFHRGHTWAREETPDLVRVGMDDFAHVLLGPVDGLDLPAPGSRITAGENGWKVRLNGDELPILAPVSGEVAEVNADAADIFGSGRGDPYTGGWLLKVRVPSAPGVLKNLLPGNLARAWMDDESRALSTAMSPELGTVLQDGGMPVAGLARELAGDGWRDFARRALLTD